MNFIVLPNLNQSFKNFRVNMTFIVLTANGGTDHNVLIKKSKM